MAGNSGGPWGNGGGGNRGGNNGGGDNRGGRDQGPDGPQIPEIDELLQKGQERLRVLVGGGGGGGSSSGGSGEGIPKLYWLLGLAAAAFFWLSQSFYTVQPQEQSVELFLGEFSEIGTEGLNFAPWPVVTHEKFDVTTNRTTSLGGGQSGLMLTTDENIVDIEFQVVWNIKNAKDYLFGLVDHENTVAAISEAAMREQIAQSQLAPILNRDRALIETNVRELIQSTLDARMTGINVLRVNFNKVDPPEQEIRFVDADGQTRTQSVIDAFRDVQAAEQERDRVERQADAYANRRSAEARGQAAQILEDAEAYRARVVNGATGEAARFESVLAEFEKAPEVTRKRLYLETMENVYGRVDKIILDDSATGAGGQGVVPYLPLNELRRSQGGN